MGVKNRASLAVVCLSPAVDRNYSVDTLIPGALHRCENPVVSAGGKGVNVARVLSQLGADVFLTGFFAGNNGNYILQDIQTCKVDTEPVFLEGETRNSINILNKADGSETEILEQGPHACSGDLEKITQILKTRIENSSGTPYVVFSGGIPHGLPENTYTKLISYSKSLGARCILDTSSSGLVQGVKAKPYFIKPNKREFLALTGYDIPNGPLDKEIFRKIRSAAKKIDVPVIAVTLSERGAIVCAGDECLYAGPLDISPLNTIGSGDSFTAGFTYGLSEGHDLEDSLRTASSCASSNALSYLVGTIDKEQVRDFSNKLFIEKI